MSVLGAPYCHTQLGYHPFQSSVTCTAKYILVAVTFLPIIKVYNWLCEKMATFNHTDLHLKEFDGVCALRFVPRSSTLILVVRNQGKLMVTSLHAYKVRNLFKNLGWLLIYQN